jgi:hypothetical protein
MTALAGTVIAGCSSAPALEHDVGVHIDFQSIIGIRQLDAHSRRSRLCPQLRVDERHFAFDGLRRVSAHRDGGAGTDLDRGQIALGHVGDDPEVGVVGFAVPTRSSMPRQISNVTGLRPSSLMQRPALVARSTRTRL